MQKREKQAEEEREEPCVSVFVPGTELVFQENDLEL